MDPYAKSKTLAEKAAWDYVNGLPEDERFEMSVINPGFVLGPTMVTGDFTSGKLISDFMTNKLPGIPKIFMPLVDVREVAQAHVNALKLDEAQGKRFILNGGGQWFTQIA